MLLHLVQLFQILEQIDHSLNDADEQIKKKSSLNMQILC